MRGRFTVCGRAGVVVVVLLLATIHVELSNGFLLSSDDALIWNRHSSSQPPSSSRTQCNNWLGDLWEEVIEFSTYGPAERKMLKTKREAAARAATPSDNPNALSTESFQKAKKRLSDRNYVTSSDNDDSSSLSLQAFRSAVAASENNANKGDDDIDFDGNALRDLLVSKWGVPLDVDFQRGYSTDQPGVYCTILPFAFGSLKCRHVTEMDYLMHLQAIVEILHRYDNLEGFRAFVETTSRTPKPGVESVPFRLELSPQQLQKVLGVAQR